MLETWFRRMKGNAPEIDLRESTPQPRFGQPQPCPNCGGIGYLDRIDVRNRVMYQHCKICREVYTTAEDELLGRREDAQASSV